MPKSKSPVAQPNLKAPLAKDLVPMCAPTTHALDIISKRWVGLILVVLLSGPKRFNEILLAVPDLSDPLLTKRLRELEVAGLVERRVLPTSPVRVEYELTGAGYDLKKSLIELSRWGHKWLNPDPVK